MNIDQFIEQHDPCSDGAAFARKYATLAEAWDACERSDWLLWAYHKVVKQPDEKQLRLFACWCVRRVWDRLTDPRSRKAVEVAEAVANGQATAEQLEAARIGAYATAAEAEAYAAAYAAASAFSAASSAAAAAYAAYVARTEARKAQAAQLKLMVANPFV